MLKFVKAHWLHTVAECNSDLTTPGKNHITKQGYGGVSYPVVSNLQLHKLEFGQAPDANCNTKQSVLKV